MEESISKRCGHCGEWRDVSNGAWLRQRRMEAGVGLRALARATHLSAAYLSDVERGRRDASGTVQNAYGELFMAIALHSVPEFLSLKEWRYPK